MRQRKPIARGRTTRLLLSIDCTIMLLSANPDHSSGADRVMRKPFNPRDLTRAIDELVGEAAS